MKLGKYFSFLKNGLPLFLVLSILFILCSPLNAQENVKVIRFTQSWPLFLDPAIGMKYHDFTAYVNLYDSLVMPNPDGSVRPSLAKSWKISEDNLTYTFELEQGVKFHNGDELTAEDVVFSLERMITIGEGSGYLFITAVKSVEALEKYKVRFNLRQVFAPFLGILNRLYILNKNEIMTNLKNGPYNEFGDYGKEWLNTHEAGSGPYKLKEINMGEYYVMEKFDNYWAGWEGKEESPQYAKQFGTVEAITVKTLMSRGELEISDMWQTEESIKAISEIPNTEVASLFEGSVLNVMLHTKMPPTDDIHFRKALSYCLDYEQLRDKAFPGSRPSGPVAFSTPGSFKDLKLPKLDMEKAQKELEKSCYYGKLEQYPVELYWPSQAPFFEKVALMLQANAAQLGIKINITTLPSLALTERMSKLESTPNACIFLISSNYAEAGSMLETRYHSNSTGTYHQGEWLQDPEIDLMIDEAIATIDTEERFQKYYRIQETLIELCPSLWIAEVPSKMVYRNDYIVWPAVESVKSGNLCNPVMGYNLYFRDFKVIPENANTPYIQFKP